MMSRWDNPERLYRTLKGMSADSQTCRLIAHRKRLEGFSIRSRPRSGTLPSEQRERVICSGRVRCGRWIHLPWVYDKNPIFYLSEIKKELLSIVVYEVI
jgi:hypothetical protein